MSESGRNSAGWMLLVPFMLIPPLSAVSMTGTEIRSDEDDPGPERVWNIEFEGNETYNAMSLGSIIGLEAPSFFRKLRFWNRSGFDFDAAELRRDEIRIMRFYQRRGFPDVGVTSRVEEGRKDWSRHVVFMIDEGEPTIIDTIRYVIDADSTVITFLEEHPDFQSSHRNRVMQEGQRYQLIQHSDVKAEYLITMQNLGFAYAEAIVTADVDSSGRSADVLITLLPGSLINLDEIHIEGHETVSDELVRRQSGLHAGDRYSSRSLRNAQQQVYSHPLFRFVTVSIPSQPQDTTVDLTIRVREHPLRSLSLQGGIGLEEIIRASVTWEHRNPFGNAHNFSIGTRASFLEQRVSIDYYLPYIFNPKSRINISPFGQRLDERGYLLLRAGISNSFIYQLNRETAGTITYEFTRNREQIYDPNVIIPEEEQKYNVSALKFSGYHNQIEVEQFQGWAIRPHIEFSGFMGTGTLRYNRYSLDIRRYIDIGSTTQFAIRNEGGIITFSDRIDLPSNIRYYNGGTSSVRGWRRHQLGPKRAVLDEDDQFQQYIPIGGKAMYHFNLEIRQGMRWLIRNFGFALFLDGGAVWKDKKFINFQDLQYGLGGGLRYNSPIGPVRIDLARKMNPTDEDLNIYNGEDHGGKFNRWGLHFSIGHAF